MKTALLAILMCGALSAQDKAPAKAAGGGQAPANYRVKFDTSKGVVLIDVHRDWAPRGADRFYALVRSGFFNGAAFYRTIANFMTQFGLSIKPGATKEWEDRKLLDDKPTGHSNKRGMLTFAQASSPNTRSTQLFINYRDNAYLDTQPVPFVPIGEVVEGMEIVDQFYSAYGDTSGKADQIEAGGKPYLDRYMPKIDFIKTATIVPIPKPEAKSDDKK
jgi:peptidyl-prolyl cis-trans isomerase A (cyclophilin A)